MFNKLSNTWLYFLTLFFLLGGLAFTYYVANAQVFEDVVEDPAIEITESVDDIVFSRVSIKKDEPIRGFLLRSSFDKRYIDKYRIDSGCVHVLDDDSVYCGNIYLAPVISDLWEKSLR